jgi:GNAT superfamily N-acetyltransferase
MEVRQFVPDRAGEAELAAVYRMYLGVQEALATDDRPRSRPEFDGYLLHRAGPRECWVYGAVPVGFADLGVNADAGLGRVLHLFVTPDRRRRGIGRALLTALSDRARELGLRRLIGSYADTTGREFAAATGARPGIVLRRSILRLPAGLPVTPVPGYRLRSWVGAAPDELLDSYVAARNAVNDAPGIPQVRYDAEMIRKREAAQRRRGIQVRVTMALDRAGTVAAFTDLRVARGSDVARTNETAVLAAHRGRGLARLVKAESLRLLAAERPDTTAVTTTNETSNAPMLAINEKLGFTPLIEYTDAVIDLTIVGA